MREKAILPRFSPLQTRASCWQPMLCSRLFRTGCKAAYASYVVFSLLSCHESSVGDDGQSAHL